MKQGLSGLRLLASATLAVLLGVQPAQQTQAGAEPGLGMPAAAMTYDLMQARSVQGEGLGNMVVPSIVRPGNAERPLIVAFNGGPGAASAWLQLGLLGPLVTEPAPNRQSGAGKVRLVPNRNGLWQQADLLFIDPLGTGFSRAQPSASRDAIHSWKGDGAYIARLIQDWRARHHREHAPLYLLGESYGSERAVAVADVLSRQAGHAGLTGIILLSQTVVTASSLEPVNPALAAAIGLPTVAATSCFHRKTGAPLQCARRAIRAALGQSPTRMSTAHIPPRDIYFRTAFAGTGQRPGIYDTRILTANDNGSNWRDASIAPVLRNMVPAARENARRLLGLTVSPFDGSAYELFSEDTHARWAKGGNSADLRKILARSLIRSKARLMIAGGVFDGVGSVGADAWLAANSGLPPRNVTLQAYEGGHMFYLDKSNRDRLISGIREFALHKSERIDGRYRKEERAVIAGSDG